MRVKSYLFTSEQLTMIHEVVAHSRIHLSIIQLYLDQLCFMALSDGGACSL
jgi:hypothetical protein